MIVVVLVELVVAAGIEGDSLAGMVIAYTAGTTIALARKLADLEGCDTDTVLAALFEPPPEAYNTAAWQ